MMRVRKQAAAAGIFRNKLLNGLTRAEQERLKPLFELVELMPHDMLYQADAAVGRLVFVESGTVSMIAVMEDGARSEVGLVGVEGFVGVSALLGVASSALEAMVQLRGQAFSLPLSRFEKALLAAPGLQKILFKYIAAFNFQVAQTAACNSRHQIGQRLAKWLLMTHDRAGSDTFLMTHEFLSIMLGVRRPSVTVALGTLAKAGVIEAVPGSVRILDRAGLEAAACECYRYVTERFAAIVFS